VCSSDLGAGRGWHQVPPFGLGQAVSIGLFLATLSLGLFGPRFWCKHVCPTGALFSIASLLRLSHRKVEASCTGCSRCVKVCPFDAIRPDFTTRTRDCTFCQTCGGACPTGAIKFVAGGAETAVALLPLSLPSSGTLARRGFLASLAGGAAAAGGLGAAAVTKALGARLDDPGSPRPVRPPGSVPEQQFLQMCIRCGECFRACPNDVLQPLSFQQGLEGLWTPHVVANWSGCETSCNNCGQVCPTGAIRALPLEEKRAARIALAVVNRQTCLPYAAQGACQLCVDECQAAGYRAIEFLQVGTQMDASGNPIEGAGFLAPVVLAEKCVGCGLCQTRCHGINVVQKGLLAETAIRIEAGDGKEDRLLHGSYVALRREEEQRRAPEQPKSPRNRVQTDYLPEFLH